MKKKDIRLGKTYTDGKGNVRQVLGEGASYKLYSNQEETDCLQYKVIAKTRGPHAVGFVGNSTRTSFAAWAKSEVKE